MIGWGDVMGEDWVCSACGADVTFYEVETTSYASRARTFMPMPYACSNGRCFYSDPSRRPYAGWPVERSVWLSRQTNG